MEKSKKDVNKKQMEHVWGGKSVLSTGKPYCRCCRNTVTIVKKSFICMNDRCKEFGIRKTQDEVDWIV